MKVRIPKTPKGDGFSSCCGGLEELKENAKEAPEHADNRNKDTSILFSVNGMTCVSCANKVETALTSLDGVKKAEVDLPEDSVTIHFNPAQIDPDGLKKAIEAAGYSVIEKTSYKTDVSEAADRPRVKGLGPAPYLIGILAAMGIIGFYLGLLTLTSDWYNAWEEFKYYRWWLIALAVGLGIQAALYSILRIHLKGLKGRKIKGAKSSLAASGGISTASMAACCAHYLVTFLPVLSVPFLSAAVAGLAKYQSYFFLLGVVSNLIGMSVMVRLMIKNKVITKDDLLKRFSLGMVSSS